ncbi:MAG: DUF3291 domain-containing protein [Ktedonobacteraceae bacterium]
MYSLAQVNIARMLAPLSDPLMAGFVAGLDTVNAFADGSPGFVWRLQTPEGNATDVRAYEDEMILVNMSVWTSLEDLTRYVYASDSLHRDVMKQRRRWFQRFDGPYMALWWVPQGHIPTVEEAKERLEHLRLYGETPFAFAFKKPFPAPDASIKQPVPDFEDCLV